MAKYLSQRQRVLNVGIVSYTEDTTALSVIGKVGIGTNNATSDLDVRGTLNVTGVSTFQGNVYLGDSDKINLGDDNDLQIYHNGANSFIEHYGSGDFYIRNPTASAFIHIQAKSGENSIIAKDNGSVELYYDNSKKFETTGYGVTVSGGVYVSGLSTFTSTVEIKPDSNVKGLVIDGTNASLGDNPLITLIGGGPNGIDFRDSNDSNGLKLVYRTTGNQLLVENSEDTTTHLKIDRDDGRVELNYGGSKKFETTADGILVNPNVSLGTTAGNADATQDLAVFQTTNNNTSKLRIVEERDINGTNWTSAYTRIQKTIDVTDQAYIQFNGSGLTYGLEFGNAANNEIYAQFRDNSSVDLFHNGSKKFETTGIGISVSNGASTSATIAGPSELIIDPAAVGDNTGLVRIKGDLYVDGTTTQINSTSLEIADFIVGIASTATTDLLADGAGIQIGPDNTFLYEYNGGTNPSLKSSENLNVASGKVYQIAETERLSADTLSLGTGTTIHSPASNVLSLGINGKSNIRVENTGDVTLNLSSTHQDEGILKFGRQDEFDRSHYIRVYNSSTQASNYMKFDVHNGVVGGFVTPLTLLGNGNVGIGTDNPEYNLDFGQLSSSTIRLVSENNGTAIRVGAGGDANDVTLLRVDGTSSGVRYRGESNVGGLGFSIKYMGSRTANNNSLSIFGDNGSVDGASSQVEAVTVLQDGKIGIGSTVPDYKLSVLGDIQYQGAIIASDGGTSNIDHFWHYDDNNSAYGQGGTWHFVSDSTYQATGNSAIRAGAFANMADTGTASQKLQITGGAYVSGNLGVGATNPQNKLKVYGNAWIDSFSGDVQSRAQGLTVSNAPSADWTPGTDTGDSKRNTTFATKGSTRPVVVTWRNIDDYNAFWDFIADGNTNKFYIQQGGVYEPTLTWDTNQQVAIGTDVQSGSTLAVGGTITELYNGSYWNVVTQADVGYGASQVPLNQYLGQLAFLDDHHPNGLRRDGGGSDDVVVGAAGSVGIGTDNPTATLDVNGTLNVTGVSTFQGDVYLGDNDILRLGDDQDLLIYHGGLHSYIRDTGTGNLLIRSNGDSVRIQKEGGDNMGVFNTDGAVELYYGNSKKFETTGYGATVYGTLQTQQLNVSGIATINQLDVNQLSPDGSNYGTALYVPVANGSGGWNWATVASAGAGNLNGIDIREEGTIVGTAGSTTSIDFRGNNIIATGTAGGAIATVRVSDTPTFDNLTVTGVSTFQGNVNLGDDDRIYFGDSIDSSIYHDGNNLFLLEGSGTGNLYIRGSSLNLQAPSNENYLVAYQNGSVELYYDNSKKFETTGVGITVFGTTETQHLNVTGVSTFQSNVYLGDDDELRLGDDGDLKIYHDLSSGNSYIDESGTGNLLIRADNNVEIKNTAGSEFKAKFITDGAVELYYDASKKFETTGIGVSIIGVGNTATITGPSNLVLDPGTVGDNTGTVTILGDLQVEGTQTVINSTTMTVNDLNITLADGAANASAANGAGITVDGASATLTYASTGDKWVFNKAPYYNTDRLLTTADEGTGNGLDADTIDGIDSGSFLRSDAADTGTGLITLTNGLNVTGSNVGIGTDNPSYKLEVAGDIKLAELGTLWFSDTAGTVQKIKAETNGIDLYADSEVRFFESDANTESFSIDLNNARAFFENDYDTYWHRPEGDTHAWTTAGVERLRIKNNGNVGIGTDNPGAKLDVRGGAAAGNVAAHIIAGDGGATVGLIVDGDFDSNDVLFKARSNATATPTDADTKFIITGAGNVGIGTDNPTQLLHLEKDSFHSILLKRTGANPSECVISNGGNLLNISNNVNGIDFATGATPTSKVRIDGNGDVGIGTDNPTVKLDVRGDTRIYGGSLTVSDNQTTAGHGHIKHWDNYHAIILRGVSSDTSGNPSQANEMSFVEYGGIFNFYKTNGTVNNNFVRFREDGSSWINTSSNVGIGTDNPTHRLTVDGSGTANTGTTIARFRNISSSNRIDIIDETATGNHPPGILSPAASYGLGLYASNGPIRFYPASTTVEKIRIDNSGNLLINTTSATGTSSQPLQVSGGGYVSGNLGVGVTNPAVRLQLPGISTNTADFKIDEFFIQNYSLNNTFFGNNAPWNGSSHTRSKTGSVELFQFFSGGFQIRLHPSDVAGTPIPENSNFKIKSTGEFGIGSSITGANFDGSTFYHNSQGNIGINTTNPQYKLHVIGSFAATTKSFVIDHPTKEGMKLRYGSLEGPENGVYVRGRLKGNNTIELPEYWTELVDEDSITVNLTPIGRKAPLHSVVDIADNTVVIESANDVVDCFYTVFGERKDVEKLEVEF